MNSEISLLVHNKIMNLSRATIMALFCSFLCKYVWWRGWKKFRVKYRGGICVIYEVTEEAQSLFC